LKVELMAADVTASPVPVRVRRGSWSTRLRRSPLLPALLFAAPWIIGFLWFQAYPVLASIYYSFTAYNIMQAPAFVGLDNYVSLLTQDQLFRSSLIHTMIFAVVSIPFNLVAAFVIAVLLNRRIPMRPILRAAFFLPSIVPSVATATLWVMLLRTQGGIVNVALNHLGISDINWLNNPSWAMPTLILVSLWGIGPSVIIFLAGLQDVPQDLYEQARIDGANTLQLIRHVTVPMVSPVILFNLIIGIIGAMQQFALPFVLWGAGGGPDNAGLLYSVQLFNVAFQQFQMGYAAAMAWILFAIILILSLLSMRLSRVVYYEQ
jgi:multiple sugar transport system permease protein